MTTASKRAEGVRYDELASALRLARELHELPHGSERQRLHALDGLCALVGAQVGLWVVAERLPGGELVIRTALDRGWATERERRVFLRYCRREQEHLRDPSMIPLARRLEGSICTLTREQLLDDRAWYGSVHVQEIRRAARVDSFIYSVVRSGSGTARCISLHRPWGARPFTARERQLVDVFHRECRWLHEPERPIDAALSCGLAPRLAQTLALLARGLGEKQVAAALELSPHTVHEYVKALYRRFGVSTRGELLARCLGGAAAAPAIAPPPRAQACRRAAARGPSVGSSRA